MRMCCIAENERIRRQFAEKANVVGPWIEKQLDIVSSIGMGVHKVRNTLISR